MENISGLQLSDPPVDTLPGQVPAVAAPAHVHHDHHVAELADHEAVPVNLPPVVHRLTTRRPISER